MHVARTAPARRMSRSVLVHRSHVARQLLLDVVQQGPGVLVVLLSLRGHEVGGKSVEMIEDGSANLFVRGGSRPEVRGYPAGNADHAPKWGRAKFFVLCHQEPRPAPEVLEKPVEFAVHLVGVGNFPVGLFDILHHVDDLTQDSVESVDRIVWWHVGEPEVSFVKYRG